MHYGFEHVYVSVCYFSASELNIEYVRYEISQKVEEEQKNGDQRSAIKEAEGSKPAAIVVLAWLIVYFNFRSQPFPCSLFTLISLPFKLFRFCTRISAKHLSHFLTF